MNHEQAKERFEALLDLVDQLHVMSKADNVNAGELTDQYYRLTSLNDAFNTDCLEYLKFARDHGADSMIASTVAEVSITLHCTANHLAETQARLKTNILDKLIAQTVRPTESAPFLGLKKPPPPERFKN